MAGLDTISDNIDKSCDTGKKLFDTLRHIHDPAEAIVLGHEIAQKAAEAAHGITLIDRESAWGELEANRLKRQNGQGGC